jgi:hypothetical protein
MEIKDLKNFGKFGDDLDKEKMIVCPKCKGSYGINKWLRLATDDGLECPGCNSLFEKDVLFDVKPVTRIPKPKNIKAEANDKMKARERLSVSALGGSKTN